MASEDNKRWFAPFSATMSLPQPLGQQSHVVSVGSKRRKLSVSNPSAPIIRKVGETIAKKVAANNHRRVEDKPASFYVETSQPLMHDGDNALNRLKTLADATKYPPRKPGEKMARYRAVSDDAVFAYMSIRNTVTGAQALTSSSMMSHVSLAVSEYSPDVAQATITSICADPDHVIYHIPGRPPPIQPNRMVNSTSVVKTATERKQLKRLCNHKAARIRGTPAQLAALVREGASIQMHMQFTFHSKSEPARTPTPKVTSPDIDNCATGAKILLPEIPVAAITNFSADKRVMRTPKIENIDTACIVKTTAPGVLIYICKAQPTA